jgi:hypothetical protein
VIAAVETVDGVVLVDVEEEAVLGPGTELPDVEAPKVDLPRVVATAGAGATVVAVVDRRPPLAISRDAGETWREAGGGLPAGFAIAVADDDPDRMLYAGRNRPTSRRTAASSGAAWPSSSPTSSPLRGLTE